MNDERSLERAARSFLEPGPTRAPEAAVEAALARIQTIPQERDWHVPWRNRPMTMPVRLLVAAVAIAIVAAGGALILGPRGPGVGPGTSPSPSERASPSLSPSPSPTLQRAAAPDTTLGDWQAMSDVEVPGRFGPGEHIQLSIDWQSGEAIWIQTDGGSLVLRSDTLAAPANEIHLVTSRGPDAAGCGQGEVGRYAWSRSGDGQFLELTVIEDDCANRSGALSRTWVHSLSAVTDGRTGVFPFSGGAHTFEGGVRMTLPEGRFGLGGAEGLAVLRSMEGPERVLVAMEDPLGIDEPCGAIRSPIDIPRTTDGFVAYVQTLPGFTATTEAATVGGRPAVHVTLESNGPATCLAGEIAAFHGTVPTADEAEWFLTIAESHSLWIVDTGGGHTALFIYEGSGVTPDEERSVISTFEFLTELPSP